MLITGMQCSSLVCNALRWCWLGVGVLIFWIFLGNVVCVLAHQLLGPWDVVTAVMSQEALQEKEFAKRGNKGSQGQVKINMPHVSVLTVRSVI